MNIFKHSGKISDIIYALPTIKALGGGTLLLAVDDKYKGDVKTKFNLSDCNELMSLLESQPYINSVGIFTNQPITHDFDLFRQQKDYNKSAAELQCNLFLVDTIVLDDRWIDLDVIDNNKIILNIVDEDDNGLFSYIEYISDLDFNNCVFLGNRKDYDLFIKYAELDKEELLYAKPVSYLNTARLINGSYMFIGNNNDMFAIAEGLKVNRILITD